MWLVGYFIGVVVGASVTAYSVTQDEFPGMIALFVVLLQFLLVVLVAKGKSK